MYDMFAWFNAWFNVVAMCKTINSVNILLIITTSGWIQVTGWTNFKHWQNNMSILSWWQVQKSFSYKIFIKLAYIQHYPTSLSFSLRCSNDKTFGLHENHHDNMTRATDKYHHKWPTLPAAILVTDKGQCYDKTQPEYKRMVSINNRYPTTKIVIRTAQPVQQTWHSPLVHVLSPQGDPGAPRGVQLAGVMSLKVNEMWANWKVGGGC